MTEIERVPRSADEEAALLRAKPPAWEYLLFAAVLHRKVQRLEPKYRDHEMRFVRPNGSSFDDGEALGNLSQAFSNVRMMTGNVERVFSPHAQEFAFGPLGESGDADRIEHLGERLIEIYEYYLDWAADLRGTTVPDEYQTVIDISSTFVDGPIRQFRAFIEEFVADADRLPERLRNNETIELTKSLVVEIEGNVEERLAVEFGRLERL